MSRRKIRNLCYSLPGFGVLLLLATIFLIIPSHTKVETALRDRGVETRAVVTSCVESGPGDPETGPRVITARCKVRFTPEGRAAHEAELALSTKPLEQGRTLTVRYDPEHLDTVARTGDIDYWHVLGRHAMDVVALVGSVVMIGLGLVFVVGYHVVVRRFDRARHGTAPPSPYPGPYPGPYPRP
ncbi:hypothetical protein [Embleya sp. AB8]|uniref:hypothetical protein n=1 Tax=Embleya sp. AB8 TaxID=3156304 RepID=UPI003C75E436